MEKQKRELVYIIQAKKSPFLKIGITNRDPVARMREHQCGNPYRLELLVIIEPEDYRHMERYLMSALQSFRCQGGEEWVKLENTKILEKVISGYNRPYRVLLGDDPRKPNFWEKVKQLFRASPLEPTT